jgi:hypothetical protein
MRSDLLSKRIFIAGCFGLPWLWTVHCLYHWKGTGICSPPSSESDPADNDEATTTNPDDRTLPLRCCDCFHFALVEWKTVLFSVLMLPDARMALLEFVSYSGSSLLFVVCHGRLSHHWGSLRASLWSLNYRFCGGRGGTADADTRRSATTRQSLGGSMSNGSDSFMDGGHWMDCYSSSPAPRFHSTSKMVHAQCRRCLYDWLVNSTLQRACVRSILVVLECKTNQIALNHPLILLQSYYCLAFCTISMRRSSSCSEASAPRDSAPSTAHFSLQSSTLSNPRVNHSGLVRSSSNKVVLEQASWRRARLLRWRPAPPMAAGL